MSKTLINSGSSPKLARLIVLCLRVTVGGVFVIAAIPKIMNPVEFANSLNAYQILPQYALGITTWLLPWIECIFGLLLALGYVMRLSLMVIGLLLLVFLIAIVSAMMRGLNINCGCFGRNEVVGWNVVFRDIGLLAVLGLCASHYSVLPVRPIAVIFRRIKLM